MLQLKRPVSCKELWTEVENIEGTVLTEGVVLVRYNHTVYVYLSMLILHAISFIYLSLIIDNPGNTHYLCIYRYIFILLYTLTIISQLYSLLYTLYIHISDCYRLYRGLGTQGQFIGHG